MDGKVWKFLILLTGRTSENRCVRCGKHYSFFTEEGFMCVKCAMEYREGKNER